MTDDISPETERQTAEFRARLGMNIVVRSSWALAAVSIVAIVVAFFAEVAGNARGATLETTRMVFTAVLPLLGTWVGTVLAFFYTKEGLETASRTTIAAVRSGLEKLEKTQVRDKMIPVAAIEALRLAADQTLAAVTVAEVEALFAKTIPGRATPITRLPILGADGRGVGILHDSAWLALQNTALRAATALTPTTPLSALFAAAEAAKPAVDYEKLVTGSIAFVAEGKTLADAKRQMEVVAGSQDVFVTASGLAGDRVVGWLPNVVIARESRA